MTTMAMQMLRHDGGIIMGKLHSYLEWPNHTFTVTIPLHVKDCMD